MQRWEYQTFLRTRGWGTDPGQPKAEWWKGGNWSTADMKPVLEKLGNDGWELVAISARSGYLGAQASSLVPVDYAGFTNEEVWVFKRPKD